MNYTAIFSDLAIMNLIRQITRSLTHLFFPNVCHGCSSDLVNVQQLLCLQCLHRLPYTNFHLHGGNPVEKIFWGRLPVMHAAAVFYLTKNSVLQQLLYQLKYNGKKEVGDYCGRLMGQCIKDTPMGSVDALVPLPLFPKKERMRGYNQSTLLCEGIASVTGVPVWKDVLQRVTTTSTQTRKNRVERWQNMEGRFLAAGTAKLRDRHVLLVDDVITTGATLEACGSEVVAAGGSLSILTLGYSSSRNV